MRTGLVVMPSARASANSSNGFVELSWKSVSRLKLGDDVVVVRVEPLRHLAGEGRGLFPAAAHSSACALAGAAGDLEAQCQLDGSAVPLKARRDISEQAAHVEHLVVEAEVVGRDEVDPGRLLLEPVVAPELRAGAVQLVRRELALPVGFGGFFEFALLADARKAQVVRVENAVHGANRAHRCGHSHNAIVLRFIIRRIYDGFSRMLELRHLKTLVALAETGNLSKAAKRVNLSQPAVSHQIRAMEEHYEIELFERKSDPLRLTAAGQRFVELAYEVTRLRPGRRARPRPHRAGPGGTAPHRRGVPLVLRLADARDGRLSRALAGGGAGPGFRFPCRSHRPAGRRSRGSRHRLPRGKTAPTSAFHPLFAYEVLALLSRHHPLTRKPYLTARDFKTETLVTYPIPDDRLDLVRDVLKPGEDRSRAAHHRADRRHPPARRQRPRRGAALPGWTVQPYLDRNYVVGKPVGKNGLHSRLYAATTTRAARWRIWRSSSALCGK